jgi:hypothetical protein
MATARFFVSLCLLALCCALLVATNRADAHSLTPASASAISRASIERTARFAHFMSSDVEFMDSIFQLDH